MLSTNNNIDFKEVAKNLKKELSTLNFDLSHSATLNLLSRATGYENYNTFKSIVTPTILNNSPLKSEKENTLYQLLNLSGLNEEESIEATLWVRKSQFKNLIDDIIIEARELISDSGTITLNKFYLDSYESIFYKYISNFLPRISDIYLSEFYLEDNNTLVNELINAISKISNHDLVLQKIENHINCSSEEFKLAITYALEYEKDKNGNSLELIDTPHLELLRDIFDFTSDSQSFNLLKFNKIYSRDLNELTLESLHHITYKLLSIDEKISVNFHPLLLLNKLDNNNYQVHFNELFEKIAL